MNYDPKKYQDYDMGHFHPQGRIRPAIIQYVNPTTGLVDVEWLDYPGIRRGLAVTQPQLGMYAMPVVGTVVLIGFDNGYRAQILRVVPTGYDKQVDTGQTWAIRQGELLLQSYIEQPVINAGRSMPVATGTSFYMSNIGDITMSTSSGESWAMDNDDNEISQNSMNFTCITEAGQLQFGLVKRDINDVSELIKTTGGKFITGNEDGLTEFRLRLLETADTNPLTDPEVDTDPFIELTLGTKVDNSGKLVKTNNSYAVPDKEIMIQLKTKAKQGFNFTIDKDGNLTVLVKGDVKVKVDGSANINVGKNAKVVAGSKVEIDAPTIEVGGKAGIVLDTFLTSYDLHTHATSAAGTPTSPPVVKSLPSHKSKKAKAG